MSQHEKARMLYILADAVACGCADVEIATETDGIRPNVHAVGLQGWVRGCVKRDHAKDWPAHVTNLAPDKLETFELVPGDDLATRGRTP